VKWPAWEGLENSNVDNSSAVINRLG